MLHDDALDLVNLDDGCYLLERRGSFNEAVRFATAEWTKLYVTKVRLPDGVGNIVYLLTNTFENTFRLLDRKDFIAPTSYRKFFYPTISYGTFFNRRYRLNLTKDRTKRVNFIKNNSKLVPYAAKKISAGDKANIFFCLADIFSVTSAACSSFPAKRISSDFFPQFGKIITGLTPAWSGTPEGENNGNRIMIIDAETFGFKAGASLAENKLNPLFMIYLAFFRTRDLSQWHYDQTILVTSGNMFIKFNPSRLTPKDFNRFRSALFRVMKSNLDEYTAGLSDIEQNELLVTAGDITTAAAIDGVVDAYTKFSSPAVKGAVTAAIDTTLHDRAVTAIAKADLTTTVQSKFSEPEHRHQDLFRAVNKLEPEELASLTTRDLPPGIDDDVPDKPAIASRATHQVQPVSLKPIGPEQQSVMTQSKTIKPANQFMSGEQQRQAELERLYRSILSNERLSLTSETDEDLPAQLDEDDLESEIMQILTADEGVAEEIADEIQEHVMPMTNPKTAPISSARDTKLREAQKKVVVRDSTIEEILNRDSSKVIIPVEDKSKVMTTTNQAMKEIKFANFDKAYQDNLLNRDIVACFDALKNKPSPLYVKSINVADSSTITNLKETWTVRMVDQTGIEHRIVVDLPKFYQNRFMILEGNRYVILKQNFFMPVIKDTVDTVLIHSSNKKITVQRKSGVNMTLSQVGRLFKLVSKFGDDKMFLSGDSSKINNSSKYVSSLEFDEISRRLFQYTSGKTRLYFNRQYLAEMILPTFKGTIQDDEFLIGYDGTEPIVINDSTGHDRHGRTICEIIEATLSPEAAKLMATIKLSKQAMFAEAKLAGSYLPIGVVLVVWHGLKHLLTTMEIDWKFNQDAKRLTARAGYDQIKFADGILEYKSELFAQLILNGLAIIGTNSFNFSDFETEKCYYEYLHSKVGTYTFKAQLMNFRDFFIDPITEEVCKDIQLPWEVDKLMIYAIKLLCDNSHRSKVFDGFYRTRSTEIIPAILYASLATQYQRWYNSGQRNKYSIPQNVVIKELMAQKTVENFSILNPATEVGKLNTISAKGYAGSNMDRAYNNEEKRSYDPSSVGKLAISSPPDANIGITRELVLEPTITNARGYRKIIDDTNIDELTDVNIFSPVELLTPGTAATDDPTRVAMANKQTKHLVPVENAVPALISNGYDEAIQFHLSNDFVVNADEPGEVVELDEATGIIVVKYASGKCQAFNTKPEIVKNSGSDFYLSYTLKPAVKVGDKVVKDQVLAYHDKYFNYSKMNGLRYAIGPLVKIAFMSTYNTYEDAGICTKKLSEMIRTLIVYQQDAPLTKSTNVISMVNVGDEIRVNDPLIKFEVVSDDASIANFINRLPSDESKELVSEMGKSAVFASHSGKIVKIKVTSLLDPADLTESLGKIVTQYWHTGIAKEELLNKYDDTPGIIKAGYLMTDPTGVHKNRYNKIGHYAGKDVVIEFFMEHSFVAGTGDKVAIYGANKNIIGELIEEGYEPYSEFRPEEEISILTSPGTIARRMTQSVLPISAAMKCMLELKRKLKAVAKFN